MENTKNRQRRRNLRKIPDHLQEKIKQLKGKEILISCVKCVSQAQIEAGDYEHLGIHSDNGQIVITPSILPPKEMGRYSRMNVTGDSLPLKNLPKRKNGYVMPNWGDWSNGSHIAFRDAYQRKLIGGLQTTIKAELLEGGRGKNGFEYLINFVIEDPILIEGDLNFESRPTNRLFFNLNLLQENVRACDVFASDAPPEVVSKTVQIDWEVLPPGMSDQLFARVIPSNAREREALIQKIEERRKVLEALIPQDWICGTSGFRRYFGARFTDKLVVFENIEHGNAIYVMFEDWRELSQLSRTELLCLDKGFERIVHRRGWQNRLKRCIQHHCPDHQAAA